MDSTKFAAQKIHYTLRLAVAMCFIGHGAFGIITKPIWANYFAVFGIHTEMAYKLMPIVGTFDILAGIIMLIYPMRVIPAWLVLWGIVTASLRPLSGEPFAEFIERAGNYGAPLSFIFLAGAGNLFAPVPSTLQPSDTDRKKLAWSLRIAAFLLLLGHAWLNLIGKKGLLDQYHALGFANPAQTATLVGWIELIGACTALLKPWRPLLLILFFWKMSSELFYPHWEIFEWIERGGSYGCLLALWFLSRSPLRESQDLNQHSSRQNGPAPLVGRINAGARILLQKF